MRRSSATALLLGGLVIVAASTACGGGDQTANTSAVPTADVAPSHVWAMNGNGEPAVGEVSLTFSGKHELAADAVSFDGASGFAASAGPGPVETTESFSITAWVALAPATLGGSVEFATAVSQLGDEAAAFYLGVAEGAWAFSMKDADTSEPGHTVRAQSELGTQAAPAWVYLVGVHDQPAGQIRLFVNGDPAAETAFTTAWRARGALTIGRSQARSAASDFWPGAIVDVRVYASALDDREVRDLANRTRPTATPPTVSSIDSSALPNGTYEYTYTPQEAATVIAMGFSPEEAAQAGYPGSVSTLLRFQDGQWQQFFSIDGVVYTVNGQPEGDGGTFTVQDDLLVTSNGSIDITYRWSLDDHVLSLTLLDDTAGPEDAAVARLITEHDFTLMATD